LYELQRNGTVTQSARIDGRAGQKASSSSAAYQTRRRRVPSAVSENQLRERHRGLAFSCQAPLSRHPAPAGLVRGDQLEVNRADAEQCNDGGLIAASDDAVVVRRRRDAF
jgi:hypothetical protein